MINKSLCNTRKKFSWILALLVFFTACKDDSWQETTYLVVNSIRTDHQSTGVISSYQFPSAKLNTRKIMLDDRGFNNQFHDAVMVESNSIIYSIRKGTRVLDKINLRSLELEKSVNYSNSLYPYDFQAITYGENQVVVAHIDIDDEKPDNLEAFSTHLSFFDPIHLTQLESLFLGNGYNILDVVAAKGNIFLALLDEHTYTTKLLKIDAITKEQKQSLSIDDICSEIITYDENTLLLMLGGKTLAVDVENLTVKKEMLFPYATRSIGNQSSFFALDRQMDRIYYMRANPMPAPEIFSLWAYDIQSEENIRLTRDYGILGGKMSTMTFNEKNKNILIGNKGGLVQIFNQSGEVLTDFKVEYDVQKFFVIK